MDLKDHYEMIEETARLEWQAKREDDDRKFQKTQAKLTDVSIGSRFG
jgi:hypothetical protein